MSDDIAKSAIQYMSSDYNCSQSVLLAVLEHKGLMFKEATTVSAGFGGGMSRQGKTCGAVSGGIMAIGVLQGKKISERVEHKLSTYKLGLEFQNRFCEKFETTICRELIGIDLNDPEDRKVAEEKKIFSELCTKFVEGASKIILDMFPD